MGTIRVNKLEIQDVDGTVVEFVGGGGGGGSTPAPNSVNSESIENESIKKEDLEKDLQDKLDVLDETNIISEEDLEDDWAQAMEQAGLDVDPITNPSVSDDADFDNEWEQALHNAGLDQNGQNQTQDPDNPEEPTNPDDDV